jgi:predicted HNH restriction endonuclease
VPFKGNPPGKSSPEIVGLSSLLNRIASGSAGEAADFRNPNGVYMKLMNFRRFDPIYQAQGKTGLTRGNKLEEGVWNDFAGDARRLNNIAFAIEANLNEQGSSDIWDLQEIDGAEEGRILTRAHLVRERSRKLVEAKKTAVLRTSGTLACEVCGFDFSVTYGNRAWDL